MTHDPSKNWRDSLASLLDPGPNVVRMSDYRREPRAYYADTTDRMTAADMDQFLNEIELIHGEAVIVMYHDNDN